LTDLVPLKWFSFIIDVFLKTCFNLECRHYYKPKHVARKTLMEDKLCRPCQIYCYELCIYL